MLRFSNKLAPKNPLSPIFENSLENVSSNWIRSDLFINEVYCCFLFCKSCNGLPRDSHFPNSPGWIDGRVHWYSYWPVECSRALPPVLPQNDLSFIIGNISQRSTVSNFNRDAVFHQWWQGECKWGRYDWDLGVQFWIYAVSFHLVSTVYAFSKFLGVWRDLELLLFWYECLLWY